MGGGMPYHLEKGVTLGVIEQHLNGDRRHLAEVLEGLRTAPAGTWVRDVLPGIWGDPAFRLRTSNADHVLRHWFGYEPIDDADPQGPWHPAELGAGAGTGFWVGYRGDVQEIVRRAYTWAVELALGVAPGVTPEIPDDAPPPDPIELFWTCPSPWFEAWVIRRPVEPVEAAPGEAAGEGSPPDRGRGLVTVCFMTPSHRGSNVSEAPIASATDALFGSKGELLNHPVPSLEIDYEQLGTPWDHDDVMAGDRPRVAAHERRHATWVVTHEDHRLSDDVVDVTTTTAATDFAEWGIPRLNVYEGTGDVVVVSPSLRAGGVTHDGRIRPVDQEAFGAIAVAPSTTPAEDGP